jgi:succinoglycan biosynthesis transport protein ExoP
MEDGDRMPEENTDQNKIEVRKTGEVRLERRRALLASTRSDELEKPPDLLAYWRVLRKHRWTVLTGFSVLFTVVLAGTLDQKPTYRAKALLEIENESPSLVSPQELFHIDVVTDTYLETQYKVLASDDLAERVIDQLGLDQVAEFRPPVRPWPWNKFASLFSQTHAIDGSPAQGDPAIREAVLAHFQEQLDVKPIRRSSAVEISFDSQDPDLAARVVNALTDGYIQRNLESRWDATQKASEWLSQKLLDLKAKLEKSEYDLQTYASANGLLFLETSQGNTESLENQSLRELQEELTRAQAARYETESVYRLIQTGDFGSLPGVFENKLLQDLSVRLADLQSERAQLEATFTGDYPKMKQTQSQIAEIQAALDRERQRAAQKISNDYFAAVRRENLVQQAFAEKQKQANLIAEKSVQYGILSREVDSNKTMYEGLLQKLKEAGVSSGLKAGNIRIVDKGKASYMPVYPKVLVNLSLAAVLGLGLGICAAFLQERLDQTIQNPQDVDHFLRVPVLAFIPSLESLNGRRNAGIARMEPGFQLGLDEPKPETLGARVMGRPRNDRGVYTSSVLSEAFRELRTSVLLSIGGRSVNSILVTSAQSGEGKTVTAVNLAISLAQLGGRVLLIDADMRRPSVHKYFPQGESRLSSYLAGQGRWQDMVFQTSVSSLSVLLCGPLPLNPAELLSSDAMWALMREATTAYSFVVLDSPPLLNVADTRILASKVDATVLVVNSGDTPRQAVQYAGAQVRSAGANLLGVVLNNIDVRFNDYSQFAYRDSEEMPFHR